MAETARNTASLTVTQSEAQDLLFTEARLLDRWLLDDWLELFAPGGRYLIAPAGAGDDEGPSEVLYYVDDDEEMMRERVIRLKKPTAYAENPHSLCRRLISNVQILGGSDESFEVVATYVLYRTKFGATDVYHGHLIYSLGVVDGGLAIRRKTVFIDTQDLYQQAKVSVIL
jgi:3-phenylpropionate/cinnamic acid dioxygenase small subunit